MNGFPWDEPDHSKRQLLVDEMERSRKRIYGDGGGPTNGGIFDVLFYLIVLGFIVAGILVAIGD